MPLGKSIEVFLLFYMPKADGLEGKVSSGNSAAGLQLVTVSQDIGMLFKWGKYESERFNPEWRNF